MPVGTIVCGCDDKYAMPLAVMLRSLAESRRQATRQPVVIIDGGMSGKSQDRLWASIRDTPLDARLVKPELARVEPLRRAMWFTAANYLRILIPELVGPEVSSALYLDSDLLVLDDISPLWSTDLGDAPLGAVQDANIPTVSAKGGLLNWSTLLLNPEAPYFNSGVMLFNLPRWRRDNLTRATLEYAATHGQFLRHADQDALNAVFCSRWISLEPTWNIMAPWYFNGGTMPQTFALGNPTPSIPFTRPKILHFVGPEKPWHRRAQPRQQRMFMEFRQKTAWASTLAKLWSRRPAF
ncbi:MAG TPA: glycosyltransferase family 8 protein [Gemmatimonadales bacterium]|jgi:lipopolysaccharide biosynthesis glycosyltransferase|nr:glycosyltransferase family 8 protein [Gemmatimonadales bacterium]